LERAAWFLEKTAADFPQIQMVHRGSYAGIEDDLQNAEIILSFSSVPSSFRLAHRAVLDSRAYRRSTPVALSRDG